jgi:hypothetical protein
MGGLGVYLHSGAEAEHGRNASRHETYEFLRTQYQSSLLRQATASWVELELGYGGTETSHTLTLKEAREFLIEDQNARYNALLTELRQTCPGRAAWFASSRTPNSGRWILFSGGVANKFRMTEQLYVDALRRRCLLDLSPAEKETARRICNCTRPDTVGHITHLLDCPRNQYFYVKRHQTMCHMVGGLIAKLRPNSVITYEMELRPDELEHGLAHPRVAHVQRAPVPAEEDLGESAVDPEGVGAEESKGEDPGEGQEGDDGSLEDARERREGAEAQWRQRQRPLRADIWVTTESQVFSIDVSFVNPACRSCLRRRTDRYAGRAAKMREEKKRQKYGGLPGMAQGGPYGFTPFVIEATGRLGACARNFIRNLAREEDTYTVSNFYNALSSMTALYNSLMLKGARRKLHSLEDLGGVF